MIEKEIILLNEIGLRARSASKLEKKAMQFNSKADAKSLINVMALKVPKEATIAISESGIYIRFAFT